MIKTAFVAAVAASTLMLGAGAANAGCVGGALVGGVAGHFAGRHAGIGAVGGCVVGHHMAVQKHRERQAMRAQARADRRGY